MAAADAPQEAEVLHQDQISSDAKVVSSLTQEVTASPHPVTAQSTEVRSPQTETYLTLTGTIKRGKKAGQQADVQVVIKREDLEKIEPLTLCSESENQSESCRCGLRQGPHICLWTLLCTPLVLFVASVYSFYLGTLTWYNILSVFTDEKKFCWRVTVSPLLILIYPLYIVVCSLGVGFYASFVQVTCSWNAWTKEVADLEKGFYGWICSCLGLEDCSPYEEVILTDIRPPSRDA